MEYLDGIELNDLVEEYGPLDPARIIYIVSQICDSLYEAHTHGLVHRDIKPANVMVNWRGGKSDVVKVLDFGLVLARGDLQNSKRLAGTPLYMSPESIQAPATVNACSDIYAVGGVAYYLATGRPMFTADSIAEVCSKQISDSPTPPSEIVKDFPEDLEGVILNCLEKDCSRRPQSARDLARQLHSCADANGWNSDAAERWWGRHDRKRSATRLPVTVLDSFPRPARRNVTDVTSGESTARSMDGTYDGVGFSLDSDDKTLDGDGPSPSLKLGPYDSDG